MRLIPIDIQPLEITITDEDILDDLLYPGPASEAGLR